MMRMTAGIVCALSMTLAFVVACADSPGTGDDDGSGMPSGNNTCGDGVCLTSEVNSCPTDCGNGGNNNNNNAVGGNGSCETTKGESASSCPSDCNTNNGSNGGSGNTSGTCPS